VPYIDPRRQHWETIQHVYPLLKGLVTGFLLYVSYLAYAAASSPTHSLSTTAIFVGIGVMFVVLGNYMPKVRSNWFVGVRTPWTLSNDEVWYRTHRLTGKVMVIAGLGLLLSALLPAGWQVAVAIALLVASGLVPVVYSYWLFRRVAG
jgi:uncharacterized membrane protein